MSKAKILRFYISNTDVVKHSSLYEALAFEAKKYGLAGATIYKGIMGYGASSPLISDKFWEINYKVPVIVEIIDDEDKINHYLEVILPMIQQSPKGCMITCQDTTIILAKSGMKK